MNSAIVATIEPAETSAPVRTDLGSYRNSTRWSPAGTRTALNRMFARSTGAATPSTVATQSGYQLSESTR